MKKKNNLLSEDQHGFTNGRSTVTQLLETLEHWSRHLDAGLGVNTIYLDCQKAFNSVPHQRLLKMIKSYGVCEYVYKWIESFLKNASKKLSWMGPKQNGPTSRAGSPSEAYLGQHFFHYFHQWHAQRNSLLNQVICRRCKAFPPRHNRRRLQADTRRPEQATTMSYKIATEISFSEMNSAESWPRSPRHHVGWEWTSQTDQVRVWKRPGNFQRQHSEIWIPYHNYRQKGNSNGWSSVETLRIHRWRNVSGFVHNNGEIPPWIRRNSVVTPHLEACRGTRKGTQTSDKENSFTSNIRIWRQTQEAKATNTCVSTPARGHDKCE